MGKVNSCSLNMATILSLIFVDCLAEQRTFIHATLLGCQPQRRRLNSKKHISKSRVNTRLKTNTRGIYYVISTCDLLMWCREQANNHCYRPTNQAFVYKLFFASYFMFTNIF